MRHLNNLEEKAKELEVKAKVLEEKLKEANDYSWDFFNLESIENILVVNHTKTPMIQLNRLNIFEKSQDDFQKISMDIDKTNKTLTIKLS